jgi:general secretion pathway protein L
MSVRTRGEAKLHSATHNTVRRSGGAAARRAFGWWRRELSWLVPRALRSGSTPESTLLLDVGAERIAVSAFARGRHSTLAEVARTGGADGGPRPSDADTSLARVTGRFDPHATPVVLRLPPDLVLRSEIELPGAAAENLAEVLTFEMHRLTPFEAEQVYFDHRVLATPGDDRERVKVELTVVRRAVVDEVLCLLEPWSLRFAGSVAGPEPDARGPCFGLVPSVARPARRRRWRRALWAANVALAVVLLALPFARQQRILQETSAWLGDARTRALAAQQQRLRADRLLAAREFLIERKRVSPPAVRVLAELTAALPDSTWLQRLQVRAGQVQLKGTSPSAASLIKLIEGIGGFRNARFSAPVTRNPTTGDERFQLVFDLAPDGAEHGEEPAATGKQGPGPLAAGAGPVGRS